jgi:hypothetical protein
MPGRYSGQQSKPIIMIQISSQLREIYRFAVGGVGVSATITLDGGESGLVAGLDFKSSWDSAGAGFGGFDSHAPPPIFSIAYSLPDFPFHSPEKADFAPVVLVLYLFRKNRSRFPPKFWLKTLVWKWARIVSK